MTVASLQTLVLSWLDDDQQGYFSQNAVLTWLNTAQREIQMKLLQAGNNWYMRPVETTTVQYQNDYVLPSDFMVEHRIELVLSGTNPNEDRQPLTAITTNQQDMVSIQSGTPTNYYIKKDRITISPSPSQAWTLRLYYSPLVANLTSQSDVPDIPEQFMEYCAILAAYNGFIRDDRAPANLVMKKDKWEQLLDQMAINRTQDAPRQVVDNIGYDSGQWF